MVKKKKRDTSKGLAKIKEYYKKFTKKKEYYKNEKKKIYIYIYIKDLLKQVNII